MLSLRTRSCLWLTVVGVVYVLLVLVLHRGLRRLDAAADADDVTAVDGRRQPTLDAAPSRVDEPPPLSLTFPVVRRCVGSSLPAAPSKLLPVGRDWLYTAYFDDRLGAVAYIRVLALLRRRVDLDRAPTFYFRWQKSAAVVGGNVTTAAAAAAAEVYEMCENHGRRYGGWILSARYDGGRLPPCSVVVTPDLDDDPADEIRLPVFRMGADDARQRVGGDADADGRRRTPSVSPLPRRLSDGGGRATAAVYAEPRREFGVCVAPLYGAITTGTLVQFVELTRLLGAQHFVFYVSAGASDPLRRVLDRYAADGVATVLRWVLPAAAVQSVWNNGQLLAVNDCLYRTAHAFQHVAFNDVDEFIVPHSATNWSSMIAQLATGRRGPQLPVRHDNSTSRHLTG